MGNFGSKNIDYAYTFQTLKFGGVRFKSFLGTNDFF